MTTITEELTVETLSKDINNIKGVPTSLEVAEVSLEKRESILKSVGEFLPKISSVEIAGDLLRQPQKILGHGFYYWLKDGKNKPMLMGRAVMPMGIGKLRAAVMLSEMVNGRTLFFCYSKNLGDDAKNTFEKHQLTKNYGEEKSVGQCYGGKVELDSDVIVTHFQSLHKMKEFDWRSVNLIVVDEADVNGLSDKRASFLIKIALLYGIPIVAMSATEQQSSGKNLRTVFPDEILRMPIPAALPQLFELGLVPKMSFHDLYFDLQLAIDTYDLQVRGDLTSLTVRKFIKSTAWNQMILDHFKDTYLLNNQKSKGVVIFRDNKLVDDFIKRASARGIKALRFTGDLSSNVLNARQNALDKGDIDLLVGSKLLGRGFNVEGINVVYNSTISYSPQVFWQAEGRGMRLDNANADKNVDLFAVLPRFMFDKETGDPLKSVQRPLCHAAFFDPEYFDRGKDDDFTRNISVPDLHIDDNVDSVMLISDVESVRSVEEVSAIIEKYRKEPDGFVSKPRIYAELLESLSVNDSVSYMINFLKFLSNYKIRKCAEWLLDNDEDFYSDDEIREVDDSLLKMPVLWNNPRLEWEKEIVGFDFYYDKKVNITYEEERQLIYDYKNGRAADDLSLKKISDLAFQKLLDAHMPFIKALAKYFADSNLDVDIDDFIQIGCEEFFKGLDSYSIDFRVRLAKYLIKLMSYKMLKIKNEIKLVIKFPAEIMELLIKMEKLQVRAVLEKGRRLHEDELAELMYMPVEKVRKLKDLPYVDLVDSFVLEELDGQAVDAEQLDYLERKSLKDAVWYVLATLNEREEFVLNLIYGLNGNNPSSFLMIGKSMGLSGQRVSQIKRRALRKLRRPSKASRLKIFQK